MHMLEGVRQPIPSNRSSRSAVEDGIIEAG